MEGPSKNGRLPKIEDLTTVAYLRLDNELRGKVLILLQI